MDKDKKLRIAGGVLALVSSLGLVSIKSSEIIKMRKNITERDSITAENNVNAFQRKYIVQENENRYEITSYAVYAATAIKKEDGTIAYTAPNGGVLMGNKVYIEDAKYVAYLNEDKSFSVYQVSERAICSATAIEKEDGTIAYTAPNGGVVRDGKVYCIDYEEVNDELKQEIINAIFADQHMISDHSLVKTI